MKIKQQRGPISKWELDVTCTRCGTIITLEKSKDMYAKLHPIKNPDDADIDYAPNTYHYICPECRKKNKVDSKLIREDIKEKIKIRK